MRTIRFFLILGIINVFIGNAYSQEMKIQQENEAFLKIAFSKVAPKDYINLIPYQDTTTNWGYIDKDSKKIIVKPFLGEPLFFNPGIEGVYNGNNFSFDQNGNLNFKYNYPENENYTYFVGEENRDFDNKVRSSKNGFIGFTVDSIGNLLTYSDLYQYNNQGIPGWNISVFKWKDKYYGIVRNKTTEKKGIIDSEGNPLKGFDFNYDELIYCRYKTLDKENIWFYFKNEGDKYFSMINTRGKKKFENEIFGYPCTSANFLGYSIFTADESYSVFDHYNLKWVIKSQKKYKIDNQIFYSSTNQINFDKIEERENIEIYFLVRAEGGNYFLDKDLNEYKPKK